jgi:hypothetical protein
MLIVFMYWAQLDLSGLLLQLLVYDQPIDSH